MSEVNADGVLLNPHEAILQEVQALTHSLTAEEPDENSAINEDNVAEEVLDIDDMEGEDDEIALDEMDEVGDGSEA